MNFHYHNKLIIEYENKTYTFFNTMLKSVFEPLKNLNSFSNYISIGTGEASISQNEYHLTSPLKTYPLETEVLQNNISNDTIFIKKIAVIDDESLNNQYITEVALSNNSDSPSIYNYISLISDETPNGIKKESEKPLILSIFIYLTLTENTSNILTDGNNPFISFLLGEGLSDKIYAIRGNNNVPNKRYFREKPYGTKYECSFEFSENNDNLSLMFGADLGDGETCEIVFCVGDTPFARLNVLDFKQTISSTLTVTPKGNYVLDLGKNIKSISSVKNKTSNEFETGVIASKYAENFGDKINLPFNNLFDDSTPRFLSKDGDKIFFVKDDSIYGYINIDYQVVKLNSEHINIQNIFKIVSFDNFVFILSKLKPFIYAFKINDYSLESIDFNMETLEIYNQLENIYDADLTLAKDETFMLGIILKPENHAYSIYFTFNASTNKFEIKNTKTSEYFFTYILAMFKNNFTDASISFLKEGETSLDCRIVTFLPDETINDVFTNAGYYFTNNTKQVYTKNRAVIVEKTTSPKLWVYYYPQIYRYNLSILGNELDDYISTNLIYLIQKESTSSYKIYNLVGYNIPTEFSDGFPNEIDQSKILNFEFLNDTLLIFLNDKNEPIVGYNFKENSMLIENVSSNENDYEVTCEKYNLLGENNEGVKATFQANLSL